MSDELLILMGAENYDDGRLTTEATNRCDAALAFVQTNPDATILPTGGFGNHFNRSTSPHGTLLSNYLVAKGVPADRILPYSPTAGTVEDALFAKRVFIVNNIRQITVVTSDYHMERVRYVFARIFREMRVTFIGVPTPPMGNDHERLIKSEKSKLLQLREQWIDLPENLDTFPSEIYNNASDEHKHYDNLSLAAASGMVVVFSVVNAADLSKSVIGKSPTFLFAALLILCFLATYDRLCKAARTARRVMRYIEIGFGYYGFSTAYWRTHSSHGSLSIRNIIYILGISMVIVLMSFAFIQH